MRTLAALATTLLAAAGLAACGSSSKSTSSSTPAKPAAATKTESATTTPVATMAKAKVGDVLVNGRGLTLYHLTTETAGKITCTGGCASIWLPVTVTGSGPFKVRGGGALTLVKRPDGTRQLAYKGQPLYRYSGDASSADVNGQGVEGTWFAVTAKGTSSAAKPAPAPATSTSKGYPAY